MANRHLWGQSHWYYNFTDASVSNRTSTTWSSFPVTLSRYTDSDADSSYAVTLNSSDKLAKITVSFQAAIKHGLTTCKQTVGVGLTSSSSPLHSVTETITSGLYSGNAYAWNTAWNNTDAESGNKAIVFDITNRQLINAMINGNQIRLWWSSATSGHGWIGENSRLCVNSKTVATAPSAITIKYPYANSATYNYRPWISISCTNSFESAFPAKIQISTNNSTWVDLSKTVSGTTVSYTGPIPSSLQFNSTGDKTLYFRATSDAGTSSVVSRTITIASLTSVSRGNKILNDNHYTQLATALTNLTHYYTNDSYTPPIVTNQKISTNQMNVLGTKLASLPPQQNILVPSNTIMQANNHYNNIISAAIKNS